MCLLIYFCIQGPNGYDLTKRRSFCRTVSRRFVEDNWGRKSEGGPGVTELRWCNNSMVVDDLYFQSYGKMSTPLGQGQGTSDRL